MTISCNKQNILSVTLKSRPIPLDEAFLQLTDAKSLEIESRGKRIARLRREKGLTQAELAQRLQVSQPVVSDYENDVIRLPADVVVQIAEIL